MRELTRAAVTNCHKLCGSKQQEFVSRNLEARSPNSNHCRVSHPSRDPGGGISQPLPGSDGCWHPLVCVCIPVISAFISIRPFLPCICLLSQLMVISSGDPSLVSPAKPLALNKVTFWDSRWTRSLGGPLVNTLHCRIQITFQRKSKKSFWGLPWWLRGKESAYNCRRRGFDPWSGKIPQAVEQLSPSGKTAEPVL